ncbi:hypothetical protein JCM19233_5341 [Vibrio astriarenae]|nr:hypothetical protein JCM19233_5341 [Vibrio sp. C7]
MINKIMAVLSLFLVTVFIIFTQQVKANESFSASERHLIDLVDIQGLRENQLVATA